MGDTGLLLVRLGLARELVGCQCQRKLLGPLQDVGDANVVTVLWRGVDQASVGLVKLHGVVLWRPV